MCAWCVCTRCVCVFPRAVNVFSHLLRMLIICLPMALNGLYSSPRLVFLVRRGFPGLFFQLLFQQSDEWGSSCCWSSACSNSLDFVHFSDILIQLCSDCLKMIFNERIYHLDKAGSLVNAVIPAYVVFIKFLVPQSLTGFFKNSRKILDNLASFPNNHKILFCRVFTLLEYTPACRWFSFCPSVHTYTSLSQFISNLVN